MKSISLRVSQVNKYLNISNLVAKLKQILNETLMYYSLVIKELQKTLDTKYSNFDYIILISNRYLSLDKIDLINTSLVDQSLDRYRISTIQTLSFVVNSLKGNYINIKVGQNLSMEEFEKILEKIGYLRSGDPLERPSYQIRGNIIDINFEISVRIEIEDDFINSIRIFDPNTLLSIRRIQSIRIPFAKPFDLTDYENFRNLQLLFITTEPTEIIQNILSRKILDHSYFSWEILDLNSLPPTNIREINSISSLIPLLVTKNYKMVFDTSQTYQKFIKFFIEYCKKKKYRLENLDIGNYEILEQKSYFGYIDEKNKIIFLTSEEFEYDFGLELQKSNILESINEFKEGDLVVVEGYGIGIYLGTKKIKVSYLQEKEFVQIQFKKNRKISFAIEYVNLHKYISSGKISEKIKERILSVPSFKSWQKKMEKVYSAVKSIGNKILEINSKRYSTVAYQLKPNELDYLPEETCGFILTRDQEKVTQEVLEDLSKPFPSNRLILADTGYGKTEILIRAINRCLSNGYKSILFVPTTILAYQHYKYITQRLPIYKIAINTSIYRNFKPQEFKNIDLLISTPFDITKLFDKKEMEGLENVALVVIDEEHLMGAMFKEILKEKFFKAHFLYSSATPIPRTYFMAKTGIIDLSILGTPPPTHKKPLTLVITYQTKNHKFLLIEKIISKSLESGLKTIYVNNNIDELYEIGLYLRKGGLEGKYRVQRSGEPKMAVIHAKLKSKDIQKTFMEFIEGRIDIILSTAIIQAGIDTPEFDVVIIDNSHTLGISQIYQLRGRVGRGSQNPQCFILIDEKFINTTTFERISIFEKEDLSNVEVVQKDLDIRGPGSILSLDQSGHIEQIGLIQFLKMLNQHLNSAENLPLIECEQPTYLPDSPAKNRLYRQIFTIKTIEEFNLIKQEIEDIYGKDLPEPTINLLKIIEYRIKNKGSKEKVKRVKIVNGQVIEI